MAAAVFEKIRDDANMLEFESFVSTFVPFIGGGNTWMPFDDGIYGNAYASLDRSSGTITLELYKGLPRTDPEEFGRRETWRAQIIGDGQSLKVYERSKDSVGNNCYDRDAYRPNLEEFTLALPPEIRERALGAFARINPNTPSAQYTDFWKIKRS